MWNANQTNAQSFDGGFLNTSKESGDSPSKKPVRRQQNVAPVVVRQIRDCPNEEFTLFGMPVQMVSIVGILRDFEVQSTKVIYHIEDHTAQMKGYYWLENTSAQNLPDVKIGTYVQVFGSVRRFDNEKVLMIVHISTVDNADVLTNHLLQVIYVRLQTEALSKNTNNTNNDNLPGPSTTSLNVNPDVNVSAMGLTPLQEKVMKVIQAGQDDACGTSREQILTEFPEYIHREINATLEFFISEGHAYSTVDENHFKLSFIN